jgi:hypothetical protein
MRANQNLYIQGSTKENTHKMLTNKIMRDCHFVRRGVADTCLKCSVTEVKYFENPKKNDKSDHIVFEQKYLFSKKYTSSMEGNITHLRCSQYNLKYVMNVIINVI